MKKKTESNFLKLYKNCVIAFFLTYIIGITPFIFDFFISKPSNDQLLVWAILLFPIYAFFNLIFLLIIYLTRISKVFLTDVRFLFVEIILYYGFYLGIVKLLDKIPYKYSYTISPQEESKKFFFMFPFEHIYTFVVLTILILLFRKKLKL